MECSALQTGQWLDPMNFTEHIHVHGDAGNLRQCTIISDVYAIYD